MTYRVCSIAFLDMDQANRGQIQVWGSGRVLGYIHEGKGFVRVRTSTTEAFFSSNMTESRDKELVPTVAGNLPLVTGTALTVGIPLAL